MHVSLHCITAIAVSAGTIATAVYSALKTTHHCGISLSLSLSVLTAVFQVNLGQPVFIEAKDDGSGGDNWSLEL